MAGVAGIAPKVRVRILSKHFNVAGVAGLDWSEATNESCFLSFCATKMAGVAGLEPTTPGFGDQCSTN